jgi:hypothetical protein
MLVHTNKQITGVAKTTNRSSLSLVMSRKASSCLHNWREPFRKIKYKKELWLLIYSKSNFSFLHNFAYSYLQNVYIIETLRVWCA